MTYIALDTRAGKVYWTEFSSSHVTGRIRRPNLDGTNIEVVLGEQARGWPWYSALDIAGAKMYWLDGQWGLRRANLDGSGRETLIRCPHLLRGCSYLWSLRKGLSIRPFSIALDIAGGKMYWAEGGIRGTRWMGSRISRANLDGTAMEVIQERMN